MVPLVAGPAMTYVCQALCLEHGAAAPIDSTHAGVHHHSMSTAVATQTGDRGSAHHHHQASEAAHAAAVQIHATASAAGHCCVSLVQTAAPLTASRADANLLPTSHAILQSATIPVVTVSQSASPPPGSAPVITSSARLSVVLRI
jgi:hypothetical protein